jgi:hypothetical protein
VRRHLTALDRAVKQLRLHAGRPESALASLDDRWAVERGLQLCIQLSAHLERYLAGQRSP